MDVQHSIANSPDGGSPGETRKLDDETAIPWASVAGESSNLGWRILWRVVVYSLLLLTIFFLFLPARQRTRGDTRVQCASNIHQLVGACYDYAAKHNGNFPPNLAAAQGNIADRTFSNLLTCPTTSTPYIYIGAGLTTSAPGDAILIYEPGDNHTDRGKRSIYLGFRNGSVTNYSEPYASKIIAALNAGQNPLPAGTIPKDK